ncbi:MAG: PAS domain-containing sensor histidine kinase [Fidelibacterota bacterium]
MSPVAPDKNSTPALKSAPQATSNWVLWTIGLVFSVTIAWYGYYSHFNFQRHIIANFNHEQAALVQALGTVIGAYVTEASQDIQQLAREIESTGKITNSSRFIETTYQIHRNEILALVLVNETGRIIFQTPSTAEPDSAFKQQVQTILSANQPKTIPQLTRRITFRGNNVVGIISPVKLGKNKRYYLLGILGIENYINSHLSSWLGEEPAVILADHNGDILSLYNPTHTETKLMSKGNIRQLSRTCLNCHQVNDFFDMQQSTQSEIVTHSVFKDPDQVLQNRTTASLSVLNEIWSISIYSPYEEVQGAIRKNYRNLFIFSLLPLIVIIAFTHRVFTIQKHRAILETEAKNLRTIAASSEALQESEEKFRSVIEQSNDGIYVLQGYRFVFINSRFSELTGYTREDINGADFNFQRLLAPEGMAVIQEQEKLSARGQKIPDRFVLKGLRKDGEKRDFEVSITPVKWGNTDAILGVLNDVTERIEDQQTLEAALARARAGERVKTLFLENVSHEIRTPLNSILGFSDLIEDRVKEHIKPEDQILFETLRKAGERLLHTVHEILEISQIESENIQPHFQEHDLTKILENITADYTPRAEAKHLTIQFNSTLKTAPVWCDKHSLSLAISNLVDNAIKYTHDGSVEIKLEPGPDSTYIATINDTGVGMSEEFMERMFDIFTQESEGYTKKYQGLGLGLAITKRYLDLNQVAISVRSRKEKGSTFTLTFQTYPTKIISEKPEVNSITP